MTGIPYSSDTFLQKIDCVHNSAVMELMRGLRNQLTELITGLGAQDLGPMSLGLSHSLSRYKLKFSPEKVRLMPLLFRFFFAKFLPFHYPITCCFIFIQFQYCICAFCTLLHFDAAIYLICLCNIHNI